MRQLQVPSSTSTWKIADAKASSSSSSGGVEAVRGGGAEGVRGGGVEGVRGGGVIAVSGAAEGIGIGDELRAELVSVLGASLR
jgi:hypothetical protein